MPMKEIYFRCFCTFLETLLCINKLLIRTYICLWYSRAYLC